jgi:deoxyadenosine/deoxycytidine kinase
MMAYISRLSVIKNAIQKHPGCVFISERCLYTDKHVFAKMLYDTGKIEDVNYQIYNEWFDTFVDEFVISHIIYVKTSPDICYSRVKSRSRDGEDSIPVEYLQDCHGYHTNMMKAMASQRDTDILVLNGNVNLKTEPQQLKGWMEMIDRVVKKTCEDTDAVVVTE